MTAHAQEPQIAHDPLECVPREEYAIVDARIDPGPEIHTAKVYFRSDKYQDCYFVEMRIPDDAEPEAFLGLLPIPSPETERIIYYVEAVDHTFNGARSEEGAPRVSSVPSRRRAPSAVSEAERGSAPSRSVRGWQPERRPPRWSSPGAEKNPPRELFAPATHELARASFPGTVLSSTVRAGPGTGPAGCLLRHGSESAHHHAR